MHAVVVRVSIGDAEIADKGLREQLVPAVSSVPGFVAGYWTRSDDGSNGLSMLVFESEDAARAAAERFRGGTIIPETVTVSRVEVREVVATAKGRPSSVQPARLELPLLDPQVARMPLEVGWIRSDRVAVTPIVPKNVRRRRCALDHFRDRPFLRRARARSPCADQDCDQHEADRRATSWRTHSNLPSCVEPRP